MGMLSRTVPLHQSV
nr:unnamed protein product [Callosobruchus chinensis]